jgi:hypothetical protein
LRLTVRPPLLRLAALRLLLSFLLEEFAHQLL